MDAFDTRLDVELEGLTSAVETLQELHFSIKTYGLDTQLKTVVAGTECLRRVAEGNAGEILAGIEGVVTDIWDRITAFIQRILKFISEKLSPNIENIEKNASDIEKKARALPAKAESLT